MTVILDVDAQIGIGRPLKPGIKIVLHRLIDGIVHDYHRKPATCESPGNIVIILCFDQIEGLLRFFVLEDDFPFLLHRHEVLQHITVPRQDRFILVELQPGIICRDDSHLRFA